MLREILISLSQKRMCPIRGYDKSFDFYIFLVYIVNKHHNNKPIVAFVVNDYHQIYWSLNTH